MLSSVVCIWYGVGFSGLVERLGEKSSLHMDWDLLWMCWEEVYSLEPFWSLYDESSAGAGFRWYAVTRSSLELWAPNTSLLFMKETIVPPADVTKSLVISSHSAIHLWDKFACSHGPRGSLPAVSQDLLERLSAGKPKPLWCKPWPRFSLCDPNSSASHQLRFKLIGVFKLIHQQLWGINMIEKI